MESGYELGVFTRVAERGSFAAAAADLDLTPSAASKIVSRLEARLGVRLLVRTTRRLALTAEGDLYLARCRDILAAIEEAEREVSAAGGRAQGLVRINVSTAFGKHQLAKATAEFCARYPDVDLDLSIQDRHVDVIAENVDVAIRTGALGDSRLVARKIADCRRFICASPAYLARHGEPATPAELHGHNCLIVSSFPHLARWPFHTPEGVNRMAVGGRLACDSADVLLDLTLAGFGISRMADFISGEPIRRGDLKPILVAHHVDEPLPLWAVMPPGRNRTLRVRVFVDFLIEKFGRAPWRVDRPEETEPAGL